jgi:hypothetical protein
MAFRMSVRGTRRRWGATKSLLHTDHEPRELLAFARLKFPEQVPETGPQEPACRVEDRFALPGEGETVASARSLRC